MIKSFYELVPEYEDKVISISEIDTEDDTCRLSLNVDADAVASSVEAVGLFNPPVLRQRRDSRYQIVCGFRRVKACSRLGWKEIKVRILNGKYTEIDAFRLSILDNRSHRELNVVEQARGIKRLSPHITSDKRLKLLSSLLGFPQNKKVFSKIEALSGLPEPVQAGVADEIVSFEAAVSLSRLSDEDALSFLEVFKVLKLSQSKQLDVISLAQEIAVREGLQAREVVQSTDVRSILDQPDLNRNEKGSRLRAYLKQRRFPELTRVEQRIEQEMKALKLNENIRMTPPPYFEGGPYTLRITFKNIKELEERCESLDSMARNPALKRILEPFD